MRLFSTVLALYLLSLPVFLSLSAPAYAGGPLGPDEAVPQGHITPFDTFVTKVVKYENEPDQKTYTLQDLLDNISRFVETPKEGMSWQVFGATEQIPYEFQDEDGFDWSGFRPGFSDELKKLDGTEVYLQGYMFPLTHGEKQEMFLFGPFPITCPYHYHVTPNLIIEVQAKNAVSFSYNPVNIKGILELVPNDYEYNVFYRLKDAVITR